MVADQVTVSARQLHTYHKPGCVLKGTQVLLLVTTLTHRGTDTGTVRAIDGSVVHWLMEARSGRVGKGTPRVQH